MLQVLKNGYLFELVLFDTSTNREDEANDIEIYHFIPIFLNGGLQRWKGLSSEYLTGIFTAYPLTKIYSICKQDNNVGNQCKKSSSIYTGITYRSYFALLDELFTEMHTAL